VKAPDCDPGKVDAISTGHPKPCYKENVMSDARTLVLDVGMQPVGIVPWQDAIVMWFSGKAEIIEEYDDAVHSTYLVVKVPAVVRLLNSFRRDRKPVKFSRVNIYGRDGFRCQYCGHKFTMNRLTYDHVVPRSQGGKTEWANIVSACTTCNARKAGRTPEQAKMKLRKKPVQPVDVPVAMIAVSRENAPSAWRDYLYWSGELDRD
jgi:5-methylcytosine-specific restriction endonuclease McrA